MAEPSRTALHAALSGSYAARSRPSDPEPGRARQGSGRARRRPPGRLANLLAVIDAELRTPGDKRKREPIPRVVVGFALWNLAARHFDPSAVPPADRAALRTLDRLIEDVFGWRLAQLDRMREPDLKPYQLFARQYGFLDYRWDPPRPGKTVVEAKLTTLVQRPLAELQGAADPAQWGARCGLFWSRIVRADARTFTARLDLPGAERTVRIRAAWERLPFGIITRFDVTDPRDPRAVVCNGSIRVEKELGQPWATRITHEKRLRLADAAGAEEAADALSYWLQAETVCLASPPRHRAGA